MMPISGRGVNVCRWAMAFAGFAPPPDTWESNRVTRL